VCIVVGGAGVIRAWRRGADRQIADALTLAAGIGALVPFAALYVGSQVLQPMFVVRFANASLPAVAICVVLAPWSVARLIAGSSSGTRTAVALASAFTLVVAALSFDQRGPFEDRRVQDDPRGAVQLVAAGVQPGDVIVLSERWYWWWASREGVDRLGVPVIGPASRRPGPLDAGDRLPGLDTVEFHQTGQVWWIRRGVIGPSSPAALWQLDQRLRGVATSVAATDFQGIEVVQFVLEPVGR
jgi:hypothetical protein